MIGYKWKSVNHDKWFVDPFTGIHTNRIESRYVFKFVWFSCFMIFVTGGSRLNVLCQEVAATSFPGKYILCHDCWMDSQFWISFDRIIQLLQLSPGLYVETTKQGWQERWLHWTSASYVVKADARGRWFWQQPGTMIYFKTSWKTFFSSFILEIEKHCFMSVSIVALQPQIALLFWFVQLLFLGFFFLFRKQAHLQLCPERPRWDHECLFCGNEYETERFDFIVEMSIL